MRSCSRVHEFLTRVAEERPEHPFLVHEEQVSRYGEVDAASNRMARSLIAEGLSVGDRVGILAQNSRFYVEAYYAVLKAGGIAVPLNTAADGPTQAGVLRDCGARFLLASSRFAKVCLSAISTGTELECLALDTGRRGLDRLPEGVRGLALDERASGESPEALDVTPPESDIASIVYTSGSTGKPQGAALSHANLCSNVLSIVEYLELSSKDRVLSILPFYYVYGKSLLNTHAAAGGTVVIENRFQYPNTALDTLESERCTGLSGVPSTFAILLNRSNLEQRDLSHLRYVTQAGGGMNPQLTRRLMEVLPNQQIFIMYGATEASARLAYLPPDELSRKLGSIGRAIPGVELRVLRADGREADVGEEGEIVARGPNIMSGYWNDPEATSEVLDEHGYHTGDLARRDEEGFLYIVGRMKDFIKSGAHRVSAREIEDAILEEAGIHESAVVGAPDELLGEKILAYVVPLDPDGFDPVALAKSLRRRLPAYKVPAEIVVRGDLPKNESGKIMKQALKAEFSA
ncbi:MAG: class I adenylate-forming enzyme family protein [Myxococcota bacterium]